MNSKTFYDTVVRMREGYLQVQFDSRGEYSILRKRLK